MAKTESGNSNSNGGIRIGGRLLARFTISAVLILLSWTVYTVHQLSIDMAVMKSQMDRIELYWKLK